MTKKWYFQSADTFSEWQDLSSLFSMDKQLKVNGEITTVGKDDENYTTKMSCLLSGNLEI